MGNAVTTWAGCLLRLRVGLLAALDQICEYPVGRRKTLVMLVRISGLV